MALVVWPWLPRVPGILCQGGDAPTPDGTWGRNITLGTGQANQTGINKSFKSGPSYKFGNLVCFNHMSTVGIIIIYPLNSNNICSSSGRNFSTAVPFHQSGLLKLPFSPPRLTV